MCILTHNVNLFTVSTLDNQTLCLRSTTNVTQNYAGSDCRGDRERPGGMPAPPPPLLPPRLPPLLRVHLPPPPPHQLQHQLPHILRCCECHFMLGIVGLQSPL